MANNPPNLLYNLHSSMLLSPWVTWAIWLVGLWTLLSWSNLGSCIGPGQQVSWRQLAGWSSTGWALFQETSHPPAGSPKLISRHVKSPGETVAMCEVSWEAQPQKWHCSRSTIPYQPEQAAGPHAFKRAVDLPQFLDGRRWKLRCKGRTWGAH